MELENSKLQKVLKAFAHEKGCLLLANALISGSFVYVVSQLHNSNFQKSLMEKIVKEAAYLKHQNVDLVEILRSEMDETNGNIRPKASTNQKKLPGILNFRKGVIAILAINRFCHHAVCARPYLKVGQSSSETNNNFLILLSSKRRKGVKFKGKVVYLKMWPTSLLNLKLNFSFVKLEEETLFDRICAHCHLITILEFQFIWCCP